MDWIALLEMSNDEFEAHIIQNDKERSEHFCKSLGEEVMSTFECKTLTKKDMRSIRAMIDASPAYPPPPPVFVHPEEVRKCRRHFQETGCRDMFCNRNHGDVDANR